jgi:transposase
MDQPLQPTPDREPPRLRRPDRQQLLVQPRTLDQLVPEDHPVRAIWALVQRWDLTLFLQRIRARGERPGRAATDPQLLIALWLYATIEGIGCGRQLARTCTESDPSKWLCGGVSLNYHTLNDFRVDHEEALDDLLTQMIAVLTQAQIVSLERIAQDGTRIRASAGANSFGEKQTLEKHLEAARAHLEAVKRSAADPTLSAQQKAARERGARQRQERLEQALVELRKVEEAKARQKDKPTKDHPARASATDPEARMMRMPDGGTRPAYNLELAADCGSRAIVGVEMTNAVYAPVPKPRKAGVDRHVPKPRDSAAVAAWRQRMGTAAAKRLYKQRGSTIETINGELKMERGLGRLLVRGLRKVQCAALWSALAYNVVHFGPILLGG